MLPFGHLSTHNRKRKTAKVEVCSIEIQNLVVTEISEILEDLYGTFCINTLVRNCKSFPIEHRLQCLMNKTGTCQCTWASQLVGLSVEAKDD